MLRAIRHLRYPCNRDPIASTLISLGSRNRPDCSKSHVPADELATLPRKQWCTGARSNGYWHRHNGHIHRATPFSKNELMAELDNPSAMSAWCTTSGRVFLHIRADNDLSNNASRHSPDQTCQRLIVENVLTFIQQSAYPAGNTSSA